VFSYAYEFKLLPVAGNSIEWSNIAVRLQAVANSKNIPIVVSRSVISHIDGIIDYTELEPVMVKGKSKPVDIFSINIE
ncbi:MAG: hypothetical protein R6U31_00040, partial [bacterium]